MNESTNNSDFTLVTRETCKTGRNRHKRLKKGQRLAIEAVNSDQDGNEENSLKKTKKGFKISLLALNYTRMLTSSCDIIIVDTSTTQTTSNPKKTESFHHKMKTNKERPNITLSYDELRQFYNSINIIDPSIKIKRKLIQKYLENVNKWLWQLIQGSNVLLYGIGEKQEILHGLIEGLSGQDVLYIDGNPSHNSKHDQIYNERVIYALLEVICCKILNQSRLWTQYRSKRTCIKDIIGEIR